MQTHIFPHLCEYYCRALICVYIILTPRFLLLPPLASPAYTIRFCDLFLMTISCPSKLHCPLSETLKCTDHLTLISSGRLYTVKMGAQQESLSEFHCCLYVRAFVPIRLLSLNMNLPLIFFCLFWLSACYQPKDCMSIGQSLVYDVSSASWVRLWVTVMFIMLSFIYL